MDIYRTEDDLTKRITRLTMEAETFAEERILTELHSAFQSKQIITVERCDGDVEPFHFRIGVRHAQES